MHTHTHAYTHTRTHTHINTHTLAQEVPGARCTIVADRLAALTTTHGAAGLWGPYKLSDTPEDEIMRSVRVFVWAGVWVGAHKCACVCFNMRVRMWVLCVCVSSTRMRAQSCEL